MTKLEERLTRLANEYSKEPNIGWARNTAHFAFKAGARAVLELPELKALLCSLENIKISNISSDHDWIIADEAISQWISFIGEESETL